MDLERRFRVPEKGFRLADCDTGDTAGLDKAEGERRREKDLERLAELQERLFAEGRRSLLVVLQAMDAAGKDGTIAHVMRGLNPQGVSSPRSSSRRSPSSPTTSCGVCTARAPARGYIGVFNRSHYEEVLVVRVHPEYLGSRRTTGSGRSATPTSPHGSATSRARAPASSSSSSTSPRRSSAAASCRAPRRSRKNWKFSAGDVAERRHWGAYQKAYEDALRATSTDDAPWYVVPADHKWFLRTAVASIITDHLEKMDPKYPEPSPEELASMEQAVAELRAEG